MAFEQLGGTTICVSCWDQEDQTSYSFFKRDGIDLAELRGITDAYGGIDILINNAGGAPPADSATASPRFTNKILGLNLVGPLTVAQAVRPHMTERGGGVIVNPELVPSFQAEIQGRGHAIFPVVAKP